MPSAARVTLLAAILIGVIAGLVWVYPTPGDESMRPLEDDHDRRVYFQRGSFLPLHAVPFLEVHSEYPELATWSFALPYLLMDAPPEKAAYASGRAEDVDRFLPYFEQYANLHSAAMAIALLLLVLVSARICVLFGRDPRWAWIMLLPASLFFAYSRYDVVPVLLVSTSLLCLLKGRHLLAVFILSCAVLTKWYAILFLPYYLNYAKISLGRSILPPLLVSAATALAVVGTTFVSGGLRYAEISRAPNAAARLAALEAEPLPPALRERILDLPEAWRPFVIGGARAALSPYLVQGKRKTNPGGLYMQMKERWFDIATNSDLEKRALLALTILQFCMIVFGLFVPMRDGVQLVRWMCLAAAVFVLFAKFYSPQWVMWTNALALLFMRERLLVFAAVLLDVFIYFQFSIVRGTQWRGTKLPDGQWALSDVWFHMYDARMAITALFALLVAISIARHRHDWRLRSAE